MDNCIDSSRVGDDSSKGREGCGAFFSRVKPGPAESSVESRFEQRRKGSLT